ncbi:uncharacterized protein N7525_010596 [Penicillium rubens]|uniref:uncharacterized protein n=1 Tax=Penicillium rubens TaxID=1108849 RepID=UPI002A59D8B5|nr:uncharacterized protein N7525_010596 [Penicillium rubens]KAJ5821312.1 hypothetical protein N7525_010596 [Penicillium rubens]
MTLEKNILAPVQGPGIDDIARLADLLRDAGIPSALWGVNAAGCYGGGLCPLAARILRLSSMKLIKQGHTNYYALMDVGRHSPRPTNLPLV